MRGWWFGGAALLLAGAYLGWRMATGSALSTQVADTALPAPGRDPALYQRAFHPQRLYLPTLIEKYGDRYFIVDSYNNRVLYSADLDAPISAWEILDAKLSRPHSIASDGRWFLVDDTDADRVNVYAAAAGGYTLVKHIAGLGRRPHRVLYDPGVRAFFVLASESQQISRLRTQGADLIVEHTRHLPFLNGAYTRSMSIIDGRMWFVSGPGAVIVVNHRSGNYDVLETIPVSHRYASMNDLTRIQGVYYLTATMNRMARCADLVALREDRCESVYEAFGLRGNPYYFSQFDGQVFLGEVAGRDAIVVFQPTADGLRRTGVLHAKQ